MGLIVNRMNREMAVWREQYDLWGHMALKTLGALLAVNIVPATLLYLSA